MIIALPVVVDAPDALSHDRQHGLPVLMTGTAGKHIRPRHPAEPSVQRTMEPGR